MPSLLSPTQAGSRSYTPLSDEVNPPFSTIAPVPISKNGAALYASPAKRVASSSSTASSSSSSDEPSTTLGRSMTGESEETLSPLPNGRNLEKGKGRAASSDMGYGDLQGYDDGAAGDLGGLQRQETVRAAKGKGKEKAWDVEQGMPGSDTYGNDGSEGTYPPLSEDAEAERRIQDNLSRFAARDMARRRAARLSRQLPSSSVPNSPQSSSSTTSFIRRPLSILSTISSSGSSNNRNGLMGLMEGIVGSGTVTSPTRPNERRWNSGELPMAASPRVDGADNPPYTNPYDSPAKPIPKMTISPTSPSYPSPFADPAAGPEPPSHARTRSSTSQHSSIPESPTEQGFTYGYVGPSWRGGAAAVPQELHDGEGVMAPNNGAGARPGEKWWHAICSWGADLDGGHDGEQDFGGQAGRTNPFE